MSVLRNIVDRIRNSLGLHTIAPFSRYRLRPLSGTFYVQYSAHDGSIREQRVDARHLAEQDGELYVYGWCERLPCFQALPVARISALADNDTGEMVPRIAIRAWLVKRSLH